MQLFKAFTTGLVLAVIGLFFWQNAASFKTVLPFTLDLYIREQVKWTHTIYSLLIFSGLLGLILGVGLMLRPYFNIRRQLKERQDKEAVPVAKAPSQAAEMGGRDTKPAETPVEPQAPKPMEAEKIAESELPREP